MKGTPLTWNLSLFASFFAVWTSYGSAGDTTHCHGIPSGLSRLFYGVDITILDLLPFDLSQPTGYKSVLLNITCDEDRKWESNFNGKDYSIPDQIATLETIPGGWMNSMAQIYKSSSDVKKMMSSNVGLNMAESGGQFSSSVSYKSMRDALSNSSVRISEVTTFASSLQVQLESFDKLRLTQYAEDLITALPSKFVEYPKPYREFIDIFGTHFFAGGNLGGYIRHYFEISSDYYSSHDEKDVQAQASASFFRKINSHAAFNNTNNEVDKNFDSNTVDKLLFYGGSLNVLDDESVKNWAHTVPENPWLFKGELFAIYELIKDAEKKESMKLAVESHVNRAYFEDIQSQFYGYVYNSVDAKLAQTGQLLSEVNEILSDENQIDPKTAEHLKRKISFHWGVPGWWDKTELCFRWYADGSRVLCGGEGVDNLLCAPVNKYTDFYRDNSGKKKHRRGGCKMSWGLFSGDASIDSALEKVNLCFKWNNHHLGGYRQCYVGEDKPKSDELCVGLNEWTDYYSDYTKKFSNHHYTCSMSWSLALKDSDLETPEWLMNSKICMQFYGDGDEDQCGERDTKRLLCARVGEWTPWYLDSTDSREGGCQMRWGLINEFTP